MNTKSEFSVPQASPDLIKTDDLRLGRTAIDLLHDINQYVLNDTADDNLVYNLRDNVYALTAEAAKNMYGTGFTKLALGEIAASLDPPQFLLDSFAVGTPSELPDAVLRTPLNRQQNVNQVVNYFEWQADAVEKRRAVFESRELPRLLQKVDGYLALGVADGILPLQARQRYRSMLQTQQIQVVETIQTSFKQDEESFAAGSASINADRSTAIRLSLQRKSEAVGVERTLTHEILHAIDGRTTHVDSDSPIQPHGLHRMFGNGAAGLALNEATSEHVADSLINGHIEITNPLSVERRASHAYYSYRFLLHVLCTQGRSTIDPQVFAHAMLEDGDGRSDNASKALGDKLEQAFPGMDLVVRLNNYELPTGMNEDTALANFAVGLVDEVRQLPGRIGGSALKRYLKRSA